VPNRNNLDILTLSVTPEQFRLLFWLLQGAPTLRDTGLTLGHDREPYLEILRGSVGKLITALHLAGAMGWDSETVFSLVNNLQESG
jgi:hypothetical protein